MSHSVKYTEMLQTARNLLEQENLNDGLDNEYVRGLCELIGDCFGSESIFLADRKIEVLAELRKLPAN